MKTRNIFYLALAFMALSCAKEIAPETTISEQDVTYIPKTFTAGMSAVVDADDTKTSLVDGYKVEWQEGDSVTVIDNVAKSPVKYLATSSGATTILTPGNPGTGVASNATEIYAAYPWRFGDKSLQLVNGDELDKCYLNIDQKPVAGNFFRPAHYAMAKADAMDNLQFKNVNGFIRFTLAPEFENRVRAIYLFSNNDEEITGVFKMKWNNGDPKFVYKDDSSLRTYARVYNTSKDGNQIQLLTPGDYYISILPTTFEKGFTIVLQMNDGSQLYKRTEKTLTVREGQILPMKMLSESAYSNDDVNYFVLYNEGIEDKLKIGGRSFDLFKTGNVRNCTIITNKRNKKYLNANSLGDSDKAKYANTLFFITPSAEDVVLTGYDKTSFAVIGMSKKYRSKVTQTAYMTVAKNEDRNSIFMLANLTVKINDPYTLLRGLPQYFGNVVINNCAFTGLSHHLIDIHNGSNVYGLGDKPTLQSDLYRIIIEDSEFCFENCTGDYSIIQRSQQALYSNTITFSNNIVTSKGTEKIFRLVGGAGTGKDSSGKEYKYVGVTADDIVITNNTFQINSAKRSLVELVGLVDKCTFNNNLIVMPITGGQDLNMFTIYKRVDKDFIAPGSKEGTCLRNYYYTGNSYKWTAPTDYTTNLTLEQPIALTSLPFSSIWDPENGKFGAYTFTVSSGTAPAYNKIGAQRPDMTPVTAALDSPAAGYTNINLGNY